MNRKTCLLSAGSVLAVLLVSLSTSASDTGDPSLDVLFPDRRLQRPFKDEQPIYFVSTQSAAEWMKLPAFWNWSTEKTVNPITGQEIERKVVKIKLPLGLSQGPKVPAENPMTVPRWRLGKRLYFDPVLSSDNTVSCSSCHDPKRGFTDQSAFSTGITGQKGGMSAPTVLNSSHNPLQFWDGRAISLEDQAQGPVQNSVEMFDGKGHAWNLAVERVRKKGDYNRRFQEAFGTLPTRDAIAKAIACYERTVFSGNSIHDRAERAMRFRVAEEESNKLVILPVDYEKVLKEAFQAADQNALSALGLNPARDSGRIAAVANSVNNGRELFFGKAKCIACHVGENFADGLFHNLGVGVKDGKLPPASLGRFAAQPTGHKNYDSVGAFRTPTVRGLLTSAPYMHDGSEDTLEKVVELYDRGGNANEYLSAKLRDLDAEKAFELSRRNKTPYTGPAVKLFGPDQKPIVPMPLKLTPQEKADLVLFLRALQGDAVDPIVADPERWSELLSARAK